MWSLARSIVRHGVKLARSRLQPDQVVGGLHSFKWIFKQHQGTRYLSVASETRVPKALGDIHVLSLPAPYLRDMDENNFDKTTGQRTDVHYDEQSGKPVMKHGDEAKYTIESCSIEGDEYHIEWGDGVTTVYSEEWVAEEISKWNQTHRPDVEKVLWSNLTAADLRSSSMSIDFANTLSEDGMAKSLKVLYEYGLLLVSDTPVDDGGAGLAALAASFGGGSNKSGEESSLCTSYKANRREVLLPNGTDGPLRTLYGGVWSTSFSGMAEGSSVADSAYGQGALPLHTDMTYHRDPPGLQIFSMVTPASKGGESVFADGFAVAQRLRSVEPEAFSTLSSVERTYRCIDEATGWHLEAHGPVISVRHQKIVGIRHNDLDRLPDLPPHYVTCEEADHFYERLWDAHQKWDDLLAQDEFRLDIDLAPGETVVVANKRCMHARKSFQASSRAVMGCYVSQDELDSRFRMQGLSVL